MAYGMTEGLGLTALRGDEWLAHPGSVGRGFRGTEIRILDDDGDERARRRDRRDLPPLADDAAATTTSAAPRCCPSPTTASPPRGDLGYLDDDGYLYIADRRVDLIITGGANVFPAEVESALVDHPGVADVVVIGLRDAEWGRRVHAIVEPADPAHPPSAQDVIAFAKQRLSPYKVPKTVELVEQIPRTAATKVNRSALVAEREGLGVIVHDGVSSSAYSRRYTKSYLCAAGVTVRECD